MLFTRIDLARLYCSTVEAVVLSRDLFVPETGFLFEGHILLGELRQEALHCLELLGDGVEPGEFGRDGG